MRKFLVIFGILVLVGSCKKDDPVNPYDDIVVVQNDNPEPDDLPVGNFAWLQAKIFAPTCANSGCHDGTFEPHFNSVYSSYNSLVNHSVIINDDAGTFTYRVLPGNSELSLLHERLTVFIENTSGIMPLSVEPESDWTSNESYYISQIASWIDNGAVDMFGNPAPNSGADFPPSAGGFVVFPAGNTTSPYPRDEDGTGITPILVDAASIDLWVQVSDDATAVGDLQSTSLKISGDIDAFETATAYTLNFETPITALDFTSNEALFYHKATIDLSSASSGDVFFVRTYWDDGAQPSITEIPNAGSSGVMTALFIIKVN